MPPPDGSPLPSGGGWANSWLAGLWSIHISLFTSLFVESLFPRSIATRFIKYVGISHWCQLWRKNKNALML